MSDQEEVRLIPDITYAVFRESTPSWTLPQHTIANYDLTYVVSGSGRYTINGKHYDAEAGDLICTAPGSVRKGHTYPDRLIKVYSVDFHLKDPAGQAVSLLLGVKTRIGLNKELIRLFSELSFAWIEKQPGYIIKVHGLLMLILHHLYEFHVYSRESTEDDYRIKNVIRYISAHYPDKITVEKVASMTSLCPHYFNALFKRKTGLPLHQYLIRTRIRNAHTMLLGGEYKIAEIAELCGFCDEYHLYKHFKKIMGVSPSRCILRV